LTKKSLAGFYGTNLKTVLTGMKNMKKIVLTLGMAVLAVWAASIAVETGSLRNFLMGSEPACAYDNWISHIAEGIASPNYNLYAPYDRQTNGFGDFRLATASDLIWWGNMADLFMAEDFDGAQAVIDAHDGPFQIIQFNCTDLNRTFYMLREIPDMSFHDDNGTPDDPNDDEHGAFTYGWGIFIYNPDASKPIIVTCPHPCDDFPTPAMGYEALKTWDASFLMINGSGREVRWTNVGSYTNTKSLSDALRNPAHPFNTIYKKAADNIRDRFGQREFSAQIHSYDWNRHQGYANCQISAGNPRPCPTLPIRDLSPLKRDMINMGQHLMIPANTIGFHDDVYLNDFYSVNYDIYDFIFDDGEHSYPVNNEIDLPAYNQNQHMIYTQSGTNQYDVYDPFFHLEMDELPNCYAETEHNYHWFYGYDAFSRAWDMDNLFTTFIQYYGRWIEDLEPILVDMFAMDDVYPPPIPQNLQVHNQSHSNVTLTWEKTHGYDFDSYEILYGPQPIQEGNYQTWDRENTSLLASPNCETVTITGLTNSSEYFFRIRARDKNDNASGLSNEVNTILAPANITNFQAWGMDGSVRLTWNASSQATNQGFKVYRREGQGDYIMWDSWLLNPALSNPTATSFEWWDEDVENTVDYSYKISSTNTSGIEFFHNFPAGAMPMTIHSLKIRNNAGAGTLNDDVYFGCNPYATDGQDSYWDQTKSNPGSSAHVWIAFFEAGWGNNGTQLGREILGYYDPDEEMKTMLLRTRSDQTGILRITASDDFSRAEKLYIQDGATFHNLLESPYDFNNTSSSVRQMILFWGNMQPRVTIGSKDNMIYQGGDSVSFLWSCQFPFLVDHSQISVVCDADSILLSSTVPPNQTSFTWNIPYNVQEMQNCRFVVETTAVDGIVQRYESSYRFSVMPRMVLAYNDRGTFMASNPWPNMILSFEEVFGPSLAWQMGPSGDWEPADTFEFDHAYLVQTEDVNFFSSIEPIQHGTWFHDLRPGWNFIPNPHLCAYRLEDLSFSLDGQLYRFSELLAHELLSPAVYVLRDGDYELAQQIEPWESFLLHYNGSLELAPQIRFYPFYNGPGLHLIAPEYKLKVRLEGACPGNLELGLHRYATEGLDPRLDLIRAPNPPMVDQSTVWLQFADGGNEQNTQELFCEYRAPFTQADQEKYFNIRLQAASTDPHEFYFESEGGEQDWQFVLVLNDEFHYLNSDGPIVWLPPEVGTYDGYILLRNFTVGVDDLVQSPISGFCAYPNPFNPDVRISFNLAKSDDVELNIYNLRGQKVRTLQKGKLSGGNHVLRWDGRDDSGRSVGSGIYFARIQGRQESRSIKLTLIK